MQNRFLYNLLFDAIIVAIIFLPSFTIIFLWNVLLRSPSPIPDSSPVVPYLNEKLFTQIKEQAKKHDVQVEIQTLNLSAVEYGLSDPFNP